MFFGTLRRLCLWCSELEIPRRRFSNKSLSGETGNISRGVAGHGFTKAAMIRWEGAVKPKTRFSLGQGDEIQTFNMRRRVSREFVAGPCLRNFMKQRQLRNEPFAATGKWEFRITTCSPSLICTIFNCTTGKRGFDHKVPPFHLLGVASSHRNWSFSTPPLPLPHGQCCAYCRSWKFFTGPSEKFHGAVWEIHNGSCGGTPLHDFSGTQHRVPVWNATKQSVASLDAAVLPRQGDDGYIVDHRYHITKTLSQVLKIRPKDPGLCSPRDPDCSHWPLICQDLLMDPWTLYKAISLHPDPRTLSGWAKVTKVTEI